LVFFFGFLGFFWVGVFVVGGGGGGGGQHHLDVNLGSAAL